MNELNDLEGMESVPKDVEVIHAQVIEQNKDLLSEKESLYKKKPQVMHIEKKDLSYFNFIAQNDTRKGIVGLFGSTGAGKSSMARFLGHKSIIRGAKEVFPTETSYEAERETTIHIHPSIAFLSKENGTSGILTLLDTSGHMDFISETIEVMNKVDTIVIIFDVQSSLSMWHDIVFESVKHTDRQLIIVFNKIDLFLSSRELREMLSEKIKYLKDLITKTLEPSAFFMASSKCLKIIRLIETTSGFLDGLERHSETLDDFVDHLLSQAIFEHKQIAEDISYNPRVFSCGKCSEDAVGFLPVGDLILCNLIASHTIGTGSRIDIGGNSLIVERIYLPFLGCMVESKAIASKVGALMVLREDLSLRKVLPSKNHIDLYALLGNIVKSRIERAKDKALYTDMIPFGIKGPAACVRVAVRPEMEEEFDKNVWRLPLIYQGLRIDGHIISGYGELFMDAVLHDLRKILNVKFEVLSVSSDLKETFADCFEEKMDFIEQTLTIKGGVLAKENRGEHKRKMEDLEVSLMKIGPLIGEPVLDAYLEITGSTQPEPSGIDLQRRISDMLVKHTAILEPFYLVEVIYMPDAEELINELISSSRGKIICGNSIPFSALKSILAYIPVVECFGFETDLRVYSCSLADCNKIASHWDRLVERERIGELVRFVRKTKE